MSDVGFKITHGKGFHITFENGFTVSVQFGPGNYSDHYDANIGRDESRCGKEGSHLAETACWGPDKQLLEVPHSPGDTVQGYRTPGDVLELLNWAASQPTRS